MNIHIIYDKYYNYDGSAKTIGGIQTYIHSLALLFLRSSFSVLVHQRANRNFVKNEDGYTVYGYSKNNNRLPSFAHLTRKIHSIHGAKRSDLVLWATEDISCPVNFSKTLAIQHGVSFDTYSENSVLMKFLEKLKMTQFIPYYQLLRFRKAIISLRNVENLVCVDYNYPNWLRTIAPSNNTNITIIPNFSRTTPRELIVKKLNKLRTHQRNTVIKILFARRFVNIRGLALMNELTRRLMEISPGRFEVTYAGEGPEVACVDELVHQYKAVHKKSYNSADSLEFHLEYDIAIVPSIGSEGTSLSLLEAMAAGCFCIATSVGGLTNLVMDNFNGRIVQPNIEELYQAVLVAAENFRLVENQVVNGLNVIDECFSHSAWEKKWLDIVDEIQNDN